jgi:hypothetical protein
MFSMIECFLQVMRNSICLREVAAQGSYLTG